MKSIYVGNLPFSATESDICDLFGAYGDVQSVKIVTDRDSGRPRGFAFVEMEASAADSAINALNGNEFGGRNLRVNLAKERTNSRPQRRSW